MSKRFVETDLWKKEWFQDLSLKHKILTKYIFENCDNAGVWQANFKMASFIIGEKITLDDINEINKIKPQFEILENNKIFVIDFISFQYGTLSPKCKPHLHVIELLKKHNLYEEIFCVSKDYPKGIHTLEDKDKDKEKEKDKEKDSEILNFVAKIFTKFFFPTQTLDVDELFSIQNQKEILFLTKNHSISFEKWEKIFKNASRGWNIKDKLSGKIENIKPTLKQILADWNLFLTDSYNLAPLLTPKPSKEIQQKNSSQLKSAKKFISVNMSIYQELCCASDYFSTMDEINQSKIIEFYLSQKDKKTSLKNTLLYIKEQYVRL